MPTEQTAVAGSFAEGSAVAIAKGGSSTLGFKNVCGFLAFTINADDVQSVHIYANEKMTGAADVIWNSGNPTVSAFGTFAYTGVKLTGPFTKGATYYAAVFPGTYTGLTLKLTHSNGYVSTYTNSNSLTISRKDNVVIARNVVLRTPASGTWFEKTPATIEPGVPVIIVGKVGGNYRLISNADTGDSSPSAATTATVSGSTVTDVDAEFKWASSGISRQPTESSRSIPQATTHAGSIVRPSLSRLVRLVWLLATTVIITVASSRGMLQGTWSPAIVTRTAI